MNIRSNLDLHCWDVKKILGGVENVSHREVNAEDASCISLYLQIYTVITHTLFFNPKIMNTY